MGEFFHGWRRKAGLVTLVMACVLAVGWMRSHFIGDVVSVRTNNATMKGLASVDGDIFWYVAEDDTKPFGDKPFFDWSTQPFVPATIVHRGDDRIDWEFQRLGLSAGTMRLASGTMKLWFIPYWLLTVPLTLLSAWLIVGKRPKAKGVPRHRPE